MANDKLKPVSDMARKFLAALGETAEDHQRQTLTKGKLAAFKTTKRTERYRRSRVEQGDDGAHGCSAAAERTASHRQAPRHQGDLRVATRKRM